ncbi:hypothetical protein [Frigoribacterium sp. CFBP9030]|uniref:hypothetical protein n=1 Tax=Frigoribacterium sp. CFBP9030 TaxID=3096537 RepID=UPI002A6A1DE2|nr:hypothetical protein [Frigoribacterium sp. CFBP9030]MDY0892994.1 hypothetical protein [Frigoribacterium sp. CFBP9030]
MECGGWQRIACALEEIAANTGQGRDAYEWWAQIWIPALIGLGSLLIGAAALLLTHRYQVHETKTRTKADAVARLADRTRIMVLGRRVLLKTYEVRLGMDSGWELGNDPGSLMLEMGEEVALTSEPYANEVLSQVRVACEKLPNYRSEAADAYAGIVSGAAQFSLRQWARNPEGWKERQATRDDIVETHLELVRKVYDIERAQRSAWQDEV